MAWVPWQARERLPRRPKPPQTDTDTRWIPGLFRDKAATVDWLRHE
jgi:hypothetical protein